MGRKLLKYPYLVKVTQLRDPTYGHNVLDFLSDHKRRPDRDFDLDMHGGRLGYTSFWFKDRLLAIQVALMWS